MKYSKQDKVKIKLSGWPGLTEMEIISLDYPYYLAKSPQGVVHAITEDQIVEPEPIVHKIGNRYTDAFGVEYILAQCNPDQICLISLKSGNRLNAPIKVVYSLNDISDAEFSRISGGFRMKLITSK